VVREAQERFAMIGNFDDPVPSTGIRWGGALAAASMTDYGILGEWFNDLRVSSLKFWCLCASSGFFGVPVVCRNLAGFAQHGLVRRLEVRIKLVRF
jgi:hypothetical protein